jgi:FKBP-type peptidyl-prolyl cis-trans isomerase SlyD
MIIATNTVVSMNYKVATAEGQHIDQSDGEPLVFLVGHGQIIPGLEKALMGKAAGDRLEVTVAPAEAYGEIDEELDIKVLKSQFPKDVPAKHLVPGFQFRAEHPSKDGEQVIFTVHAVEGDEVFVSGNHELAGETLCFQVEVVAIREANREEIAHGHAHGAHGHHHH